MKEPRAKKANPEGKAGRTPLTRRDPMFLDRKPRPGETRSQFCGRFLVAGLGPHAVVAREWSAVPFGPAENVDLTSTQDAVEETARRVSLGDLSHAEAVLTAQAVTLNAIFANLAYQAKATKSVDQFDRSLRLALKAQSQCRTTFETLALLKNPPVFTRQANIASQQVVNNGTMVAASRAEIPETVQNRLLEAHGERLDAGEADGASSRDTALATVGTLDGTANGGGQVTGLAKRLPRRAQAGPAGDGSATGATVAPDSGGRR